MHTSRFLFAIFFAVLGTPPVLSGAESRPNILFILADDLGWNALGCQGNKDVATPNLDRLAAQGIRFTRAYAEPQCSPTRAALLSGQWGARTGVHKVIGEKDPAHAPLVPAPAGELPPQVGNLAVMLQRAGYATGISGKWHVANNAFAAPLKKRPGYFAAYGFDYIGDCLSQPEETDKSVNAITGDVMAFIALNRHRPFFAFAAHFSPHAPLRAPPALVDKYVARGFQRSSTAGGRFAEIPSADYCAMIEHLDAGVGRLLRQLDELGLASNTVVIFTSDNGGMNRVAHLAPKRMAKGAPYEGWRYLVLSALAAGLALLTKSSALALAPFFALVGFEACLGRRSWRIWPRAQLAWGGLTACTVLACWPALWVNPVGRLRDVVAFVATVGGNPHAWPNFFLGQRLITDPGLLFYPVALAVRFSPVGVAGLLALAVMLRRRQGASAVLGVLGFVLLFSAVMTVGSKKLDRYLLPAIVVLDVLAGVGLCWAAEALSAPRRWGGTLLLALGIQLVLFWQACPYLLSAYSPLVGGISGARQLVLVGWGEGLDQAATYLNGLPDAERLVATTHYHDVLRPLFRGTTVRMYGEGRFDYCVVYVNMLQRSLMPVAVRAAMASEQPEFTAYVQGEPYAWVYRLPAGAVESRDESGEDHDFGDDHD